MPDKFDYISKEAKKTEGYSNMYNYTYLSSHWVSGLKKGV